MKIPSPSLDFHKNVSFGKPLQERRFAFFGAEKAVAQFEQDAQMRFVPWLESAVFQDGIHPGTDQSIQCERLHDPVGFEHPLLAEDCRRSRKFAPEILMRLHFLLVEILISGIEQEIQLLFSFGDTVVRRSPRMYPRSRDQPRGPVARHDQNLDLFPVHDLIIQQNRRHIAVAWKEPGLPEEIYRPALYLFQIIRSGSPMFHRIEFFEFGPRLPLRFRQYRASLIQLRIQLGIFL